jgi:16S rRNA (adenine1518-N6/adenine1519-N6)-dimethyltransferase
MFESIKSLGQNFLQDKVLVRRMVRELNIANGDTILEIGPGHGALTEEIVSFIAGSKTKLIAVEIDERLAGKLDMMYAEVPNVTIVQDDFLSWFKEYKPGSDYKIIGSLPYYITSPILHSMVKAVLRPKVCVFMVQKEVAEKIAVGAPDASYLSIFVQTFFDVTILETVDRTKFDPEPEVDSAIIKLARKDAVPNIASLEHYEGFLHKGFSHPRKMLNKAFTPEELANAGIDASLRAQNLDVDAWVKFFKTTYAI